MSLNYERSSDTSAPASGRLAKGGPTKMGRRPKRAGDHPPLNRADLERIAEMRDRRIPWKEIAEVYGRTPDSIRVSFCKYRAGVLTFRHEKFEERHQIALEMRLKGMTTREIGLVFKCSEAAVCQFFQRRGWDHEMIVEERALRASGQGSML